MIEGYMACTKARRCPVCGADGWCLIAKDRATAICPRTPEGAHKRWGEAGFVHILSQQDYEARLAMLKGKAPTPPAPPVIVNWEPQVEKYERNLSHQQLHTLAINLRVRAAMLAGLRIGYSHQYDAFTFPMHDAEGKVIGIRLRNMRGDKWSVTGSRNGLFIPTFMPERWREFEEVWVVEGPTDTAAMLELGFPTIGRPGCNIAVDTTCQFLRGKRVTIVANYDQAKTRKDGTTFYPGQEGAAALANALLGHAAEVRLIYPRNGHKDVREWKRHGATRWEVEAVRQNAQLWTRKGAA